MCVKTYNENLRHCRRIIPMATAPTTSGVTSLETPIPVDSVLRQAAKLAQQLDRPIQLDYYADTVIGKAVIGEDQETKEKLLVKSNEEYTSLIQKIYKVDPDYLVLTENSIYIVSGKVQKRKIQASALLQNE
jgi:hypothetical protein